MKEREHFVRLCRIVADLFSTMYHDILEKQLPPVNCPTPANIGTRVNPDEITVLNAIRKHNTYRHCDISLMYKIFRSPCKPLPAPTAKWDRPVPGNAKEVSDDIERIRQIRNKAFGHISSTSLSEVKFKKYKQTAREICNRMDTCHSQYLDKSFTYEDELDKILTERLDSTSAEKLIAQYETGTWYTDIIKENKKCV